MLTFQKLRVVNELRDAQWDPDKKIDIAFRGCELAGEAGEAANMCKKLKREELGLKGSRVDKEKLADELADVVICADLIAMDLGIDLGDRVRRKFNESSEKNGFDIFIGED